MRDRRGRLPGHDHHACWCLHARLGVHFRCWHWMVSIAGMPRAGHPWLFLQALKGGRLWGGKQDFVNKFVLQWIHDQCVGVVEKAFDIGT